MKCHSIFFLLSFCVLFCSCRKKTELTVKDISGLTILKDVEGYKRPCAENINCAPDEYTERKTIKLNIHFLDSPEQDHSWPFEEGKEYVKNVIRNANARLGLNQKMFLPVGNDTPVLDPGFRYQIIGSEEGDDGYYYHIDSTHYYFMSEGRKANNYKRDVIKKYAVNPKSILNIFVISHPQDSLKSKSYYPHGSGVALGTSLKITGLYSGRENPPHAWATLLNHEIGHVLGLAHTWGGNDGCDDTPAHANCWDANARIGSTGKPCGESHSNNVMDYNNEQMAYTPCQLGKIHKGFNLMNSRTRGLVYDTWCKLDTSEVIYIDTHVEWECERDINKNIVILKGGRLDVHCRLGMASGSNIRIEDGGTLHIHSNGKINNACEEEWDGIIVSDDKNVGKMLFVYGQGRLLNVKGAQDNLRKSLRKRT